MPDRNSLFYPIGFVAASMQGREKRKQISQNPFGKKATGLQVYSETESDKRLLTDAGNNVYMNL